MLSKKTSYWRLTMIFVGLVFLIILSASSIIFILLLLRSNGIIQFHLSANPLRMSFTFAVISVLLGTILSFIFGRIPLKVIRRIMIAIDALAAGDFSTRINLKGIPELQQLSKSFNHMAEELSSIEILRSDFVNNFSHEFKSPIVSMRGFAKMLKYGDLTEEEHNEYLDIIISESDRLVELSKNVLNICKIENQVIISNSKEYNLTEQIRRCIAIMAQKWSTKDPSFDFECEEINFTGDEDLISQVWINLIDNAIKFTNAHVLIHMSLHKYNDSIRFSISDNGPGMDEETQKHIFDKFYQGDTSHATHGNGLGLPITKKIIELHSGTIYVKCADGNGTTFIIELPIQK
ncbi:sensor histidine kinase [Clostridium drakei]|uniref:Heme sensor protein HssS n=1 Tax=Clostridium drakei TaxID=332101 RepID=A0A2U8DTN4_9CLOT|nr:HAMP domain-containing sensor histidine kinase [Clostridium drakei]AWI05442.1 two-component sensor histidine kinase [Clostridium drakei]